MSFLKKNKSILMILLMVGFLVVILVTFVSGITGPKSKPTPTEGSVSGQPVLVTSTINVTPSTPHPETTLASGGPSGTSEPPPGVTAQAYTESAPQSVGSPPPTVKSSVTDVPPGTDAPPPPTFVITDTGPLGTDFPPPPTFVPLATETPPPGNGPPPGS